MLKNQHLFLTSPIFVSAATTLAWARRLGRWGWSLGSIIYCYDLGQVTKPV